MDSGSEGLTGQMGEQSALGLTMGWGQLFLMWVKDGGESQTGQPGQQSPDGAQGRQLGAGPGRRGPGD